MMSAHRPHGTQVSNVDPGLARYARKSTKPGFNEASQGDGIAFYQVGSSTGARRRPQVHFGAPFR